MKTASRSRPRSRNSRSIFPKPGWVEHDPHDIWRTQLDVARAVLDQQKISASDVAAIGITNQRETTLIWDRKTGEPVYNAIVWQCRRTAPMCDMIRADGFDRTIRAKTGLVMDAYFSGTKVAWLLDNVPGVRARAEAGELAFGTVDTWLLWNLSGGALHMHRSATPAAPCSITSTGATGTTTSWPI